MGPFTTSELRVRRDFTRGLPVWYSGLPEWTTVEKLPELACLIEEEDKNEVKEEEQKQTAPPPLDQPQANPQANPFAPYGNAAWIRVKPMEINGEPCPPTYMGWNIFMLICCCLPLGVLGLIFGSTVSRKWIMGDIEGAKKASDRAAWCIIIGFVLSLVTFPFLLMYSLL